MLQAKARLTTSRMIAAGEIIGSRSTPLPPEWYHALGGGGGKHDNSGFDRGRRAERFLSRRRARGSGGRRDRSDREPVRSVVCRAALAGLRVAGLAPGSDPSFS